MASRLERGDVVIKPQFSPIIELGHVLQVGALLVAGAGFVLPGYIGMRSDQARIDTQLTALAAAMGASEAAASLRFGADEHRMDVTDADERDFRREEREALAKVIDAIGDLKAAIAADGKRR